MNRHASSDLTRGVATVDPTPEPPVPPVITDPPDEEPDPSPVIPERDPTHTPVVPPPEPQPATDGR